MAEFTSDFWSGWIVGLTLISIVALAGLLFAVYFSRAAESSEETVWDGNLREGSAAPPWWWFFLLLALIIFSAAYLVLYPGLGKYPGALEWTQAHELAEDEQRWRDKFSPVRERWLAIPVAELAGDKAAMRAAVRIYQNNCAACHGVDARGQANRFPDLLDDSWIWGGSEAQIAQTIRSGRQAAMPPWGAILKDEGVAQVADYVLSLSQNNGNENAAGKKIYGQFCVACHGAEGYGNAALGAPNLADGIWLYGGSAESVRESIAAGRNGVMPPQDGRLDDAQIQLLVAWLSGGAKPAKTN